ncbi:MAG TPA: hypothetical protein VEA40_16825 [Ramlibacter sp.]|nr:hypothetical protein [Ramlibacter sp.]
MRSPTPSEVARAIRRAAEAGSLPSDRAWSVRIHTREAVHDVRLATQAQVCRLTSDLQRLGLCLALEPDEDVDFVFAPAHEAALATR